VAAAAQPFLVRYARGFGVQAADAEDLAGDTVAKALARYDRQVCVSGSVCRGLLIKILVNTFRDAFRRRRDGPIAESAEATGLDDPAAAAVSQAPDPARNAERSELLYLVRRALTQLPASLRETVRLYYLEEQSCRRIAVATGVPEGTVISRLARGRKLIRRSLRQDGVHVRPVETVDDRTD